MTARTYTENEAWQAYARCTNQIDRSAAKEAIQKGKYRLAVLIADPDMEDNTSRQVPISDFTPPGKQALLDRIEDAKKNGTTINFCTNSMLSRGNVFTCTIDNDNQAVCIKGSSWWAMEFVSAPELVGRVLGTVTAEIYPGTTVYRLKVGHMWEGQG